MRRHGDNYYIKPGQDLEVRAIESSRITMIISGKDEGSMVVADGSVEAGYGNLMDVLVIKGQKVKRGQIIGRLFPRDSVADNYFEFRILKNGKMFVPNW
jgi:murein DD-endopeptidase MepM/ murein hydrolase activator NlpD